MAQYAPNPFGPAAANIAALFAGPDALREAQAMYAVSGVDENRAQARKATAEAARQEGANTAFDALTPESLAAMFTDPRFAAVASNVLRVGGNADQVAGGLNKLRGGAMVVPGANGGAMRQGATLMGNNPGLSDAFTQAEIDNANAQALNEQRLKNAGQLDVQRLENEGAAARNLADLDWKTKNPNIASGRGAPLDVGPNDANGLATMAPSFLPEGVTLSPENLATLVAEASKIYQTTRNAPGALKETVGRYNFPVVSDGWFSSPVYGMEQKQQPPAAAQASAPPASATVPTPMQNAGQQVEATRQLGAKTYVKINGQWFEQ